MGDVNQYQFITSKKNELRGPFLEIGSRDYGSTQDLRSLFPKDTYIGVDLSEGKSVDLVLNLNQDLAIVDESLGYKRFGTIFCLSVLEHCENPFIMAENISKLLMPGGKAVISVPFSWKFHGYPSDYWRFTHEGVKKLFPNLNWSQEKGNMHTPQPGNFQPLDEHIGIISLSGHQHRKQKKALRGLGVDILKLVKNIGLYRWLLGYRYLLAPTMINMIGIKPPEDV